MSRVMTAVVRAINVEGGQSVRLTKLVVVISSDRGRSVSNSWHLVCREWCKEERKWI